MKRFGGIRSSNASAAAAVENYEHMMMCLICRSLFDDHDHQPKFLPCHHTFCKECLREYVRQMGDDIECPSCRKVATIPAAGVAALQTNFYAKYIQTLVYGSGTGGVDGDAGVCEEHPQRSLKYYCEDCCANICDLCIEQTSCCKHHRVSVAAMAERFRQGLDTSFTVASTEIGRKKTELEGKLRALADEKDRALLKIDSAFESHAHTLARRATLLKNKVIDIYNENAAALESGLEEIDTAMTCVVSLREYYDAAVSRGDFASVGNGRGADEIDEVARNISDRVRPPEVHLVFDGDHGADKFRACTKDLGRVVCNRSKARPLDEGSGEGRAPLTSCNSDCNLQSPESSAEDASQIEKCKIPDNLASGDGLCFDAGASDRSSRYFTGVSDMDGFAACNSVSEDFSAGGEPQKVLEPVGSANYTERPVDIAPKSENHLVMAGESIVGAKMSIPLAGESSCMVQSSTAGNHCSVVSSPLSALANNSALGVVKNNYCSSTHPLVMSESPTTDNDIPIPCRPHMSYDEQHLRRELDVFDIANEQISIDARLSQSELWTRGSVDHDVDYIGESGNVIAELSGEQTSL